ncbi:MAG: hypothetical protein Q7S74_04820 [Nanoarchaeota archaeon]|nr:hypothetical protein [Nanoarchaeota archaeon]
MEKDIDRITKNPDTDIVIRVDDFGGKRGLTIREFVRGERYNGFTKSGTRIPADKFKQFKEAINSIDEKELMEAPVESTSSSPPSAEQKTIQSSNGSGPAPAKTTKKTASKKIETDIPEEEF